METQYFKVAIGVLIGGGLGFVWHRLVGCKTGACPITAKWQSSVLYGMLVGFLLTSKDM